MSDHAMFYSIRTGTDGVGLDFDLGNVTGVFADGIKEARENAAEVLRLAGYTFQADRGLFTVHGHREWVLVGDASGYRIEPLDEPGITVPSPTGSAIVREDPFAPEPDETKTFVQWFPEWLDGEPGEPTTEIMVNNTGTGSVHVAQNMTFNNLQIGK